MSNELPQLPKPTVMLPAFVDGVGEYEEPMFDSMSMLEYGRACERAAYERAAQWIEGVAATDDGRLLLSQSFIAANLRALGADK